MKHTALPWKIGGHHADRGNLQLNSPEDYIGEVYGYDEQAQANIEFIVRACNCHEELVEVLQQVKPMASSLMDELSGKKATQWGIVNGCLVAVKQALTNATKT